MEEGRMIEAESEYLNEYVASEKNHLCHLGMLLCK